MKLTDREQLLVALGAAMGSNCVPCIEKILPKARAAGVEDADLQEAVDLADVVRRKPARKVLETARELLTGRAPECTFYQDRQNVLRCDRKRPAGD